MLVDPANRLVADTLEADWNERLRALARARDECEHGRRTDRAALDGATRERLVTMTTDFARLWNSAATPGRERKRMLAQLIEDVTLVKRPDEGTTQVHVRFRGGATASLTTENPQPSCEQVRTPAETVALVDRLIDEHVYREIADLLNARGLRPGGAARPGKGGTSFTATRVQYLAHAYGLRSRFERLRARGLLTKKEIAARLGIHEATLVRWVRHGIVRAHAYNGHAWLYEEPEIHPAKHSSRWDLLCDRAAARRMPEVRAQDLHLESQEVQSDD